MLSRRTLLVTLAGLGAACGGTGSTGDPPGPIRVHIQAASTTFESGLPAELNLALGSTVSEFQFGISGVSDRGGWIALAFLSRDEILAGQATLPVTKTAGGVASVQLTGSTPLTADSGTLAFSFGRSQVSGTVTGASPDLLNGVFVGDIVVSCWVPSGPPAADGTEPLVLDADFASASCAPFRALGP
jgi:hypothetical protein